MSRTQTTLSSPGVAIDVVPCALCGEERGVVLGSYQGRYRIKRCRGCGLTYTASRPSAYATHVHYEKEYIPSDDQLEDDFGERRAAALTRVAETVIAQHPSGGSILDVGAAGGGLLDQFSAADWQRVALEPSDVAAARLADRDVEVVQDFYPSDQLDGRQFDVITMMDVIMLIPDPLGALEAAREQLRPGGSLAVEIPGYVYRCALHIGPVPLIRRRMWTDLNASIHLYFFSDRTFRRLLARAGFDVDQVVVLPPSARQGALGRLQQLAGVAVERLPGVRSGAPSIAAKYLYVARARR